MALAKAEADFNSRFEWECSNVRMEADDEVSRAKVISSSTFP